MMIPWKPSIVLLADLELQHNKCVCNVNEGVKNIMQQMKMDDKNRVAFVCHQGHKPLYFLAGHRLAHPATQAPKIRAENEGQTSMHISKSPPGHRPEPPAELLLEEPALFRFPFDRLCCKGCCFTTGRACCLGAAGLEGLEGLEGLLFLGRLACPVGLLGLC